MCTHLLFLLQILAMSNQQAVSPDGFWQVRDNLEAAAWDSGYTFDGDRFQYSHTYFDNLSPIRRVGGHYRIENDSIYFEVEYFSTRNFNIIEFDWPPYIPTWAAYNESPVGSYRYHKTKSYADSFKLDGDKILIGKETYYFIRNDKQTAIPADRSGLPTSNGMPCGQVVNVGQICEAEMWIPTEDRFTHNGTYLFDGDRFKYISNPGESLNPMKSWSGHYKVAGDSVTFRVEYLELTPFDEIKYDADSGKSDPWSIVSTEQCDPVTFRFENPVVTAADFVVDGDIIWINGEGFKKELLKTAREMPDENGVYPVFKSFFDVLGGDH